MPSSAGWAEQFDTIMRRTPRVSDGAKPDPLIPPIEYRSEGGQLNVTLEAQPTPVNLGPYRIEGATYSGVYGGPVLRLRPGDTLRLKLANNLPRATNIHFHGLQVSPQDPGDNSMRMVEPGETWEYVIPIPKSHPPGVYWFHTHAHRFAERQLMGGLSGTLIIEGFQDEIPVTLSMRERLFALKEFTLDASGGLAKVPKPFNLSVKTINGQLIPRIDIAPGERQLWRFSDQTSNTYFRLSLGGQSFLMVGQDSRPMPQPREVKELILGPGERADVIVVGGPSGRYVLRAEKTSSGPGGDMFPGQDLALVVSDGPPAPPSSVSSVTVAAGVVQPIPAEKIDEHRLVVFSSDGVTGLFFINHQTFDHERVDVRVPLGNTEEWTIRNSSDELHIFHIHQTPFQIVSENGRPVEFHGLKDTVSVPIHGEVKIRIPFTNPAIVGRFMFHCHILEHEDKGMMAQIEVFDPNAPSGLVSASQHGGHHGH